MIRWKAGELIRKKHTGYPYLVLHVQRGVCTLIADAKETPTTPLVILEHQYDQYATDKEMQHIEYNDTWEYKPNTL